MTALITQSFRDTASKRWLQLAVVVAALVPVAAGLDGIVKGAGMFGHDAVNAGLDSHLRYLSGLLLALGLSFWSTIPHIERRGPMIRLLTAAVVIGGLARAYSLWRVGLPSTPMRLALIMELVVTPMLCLWQMQVARSMDAAPDGR